MKYFAVLLAVAFVATAQALTEEQKTKIKEHHRICREESGVDPNLIAEMRKGQFSEDAKLKNFVKCFFLRAQFMNDNGVIQPEVIKAKSVIAGVDQGEAEKVINACKDKKGSDAAETAYAVYRCYWDTAKVHLTLV